MSITDELREWAGRSLYYRERRDELTAIADRIDAEHENAMAAAALIAGVPMTDEHIAEHCWGRLPKDVDGAPIRVGDVMENIVCPSVHREVTGVGDECFYGWDDGNGRYSQFDANCYRHHHAPTVEDVLREMADRCYADEDEPRDRDAIVAEFAAKLRLAGDAE